MKRLPLLALSLLLAVAVFAQDERGPIMWQDQFEDDDVAALMDVGWIYYPEEDVQGQTVEQREGELFIEAGSYGGIAAVGVVETNGVPKLEFDENGDPTAETVAAVLQNNYSDPNQDLTFQINFKKFSASFFIVATRMVMDSSRADADPTVSPAYTLFVSPLEDVVRIAKYPDVENIALAPDAWTYFGQGAFDFELDVYYYFRYRLDGGDLKLKVWEGELEDEPAEWLLQAVDPDPRVTGKFTMFGLLGAIPGDQIVLDNIYMHSTSTTAVEPVANNAVPTDFVLEQNSPNPFNPTTEIGFELPVNSYVTLSIYNSLGQKMATVVDGEKTAGSYRVSWDSADAPSGVYFYRLQADGFTQTKKMMLMK